MRKVIFIGSFLLTIGFWISLSSQEAPLPEPQEDLPAAEGNQTAPSPQEAPRAPEEVPPQDVPATAKEEAPQEFNLYKVGDVLYTTSKTTFSLKAEEGLSKIAYIEYRIDGSPYMRYESPFQIFQEGRHQVYFRAVDIVGNKEVERVVKVVIDNTPPEVGLRFSTPPVEVEGRGYYAPLNLEVEIVAEDALSGVEKIEYSINNATFEAYGEPIKLSQKGKYHILYRAIDKVGNVSKVKSYVVEIDGDAPVVSIEPAMDLIEHEGKKFTTGDNVFSIKAKDASSGVKTILVKVDGEANFSPYATPLVFEKEGNHVIEAKAIDLVGNESEVIRLEFIVDNTPPSSSITPSAP